MEILPLYYLAADVARRYLETGELVPGRQQPRLLLAGRPSRDRLLVRDLADALFLREGGPALLPGAIAQAMAVLHADEWLIVLADTVLYTPEERTVALLAWVGSHTGQALGVHPVVCSGKAFELDVRPPSNLSLNAPSRHPALLFPPSRVVH